MAIAAIIVVLYLLATIPLISRSYTLTVVSTHILPFTTEPPIYANDSGWGSLWVPTGSEVSGSWVAENGTVILMFVEYGTSCSQSNSTSRGSFDFAGGLPLGPGGTSIVYFDIMSSSSVSVTIEGTYTAPLI